MSNLNVTAHVTELQRVERKYRRLSDRAVELYKARKTEEADAARELTRPLVDKMNELKKTIRALTRTQYTDGTRFCHMGDCDLVTKRSVIPVTAAITAAYRISHSSENDPYQVLQVGYAFCSPTDMHFRTNTDDNGSTGYQKSIGREIAYKRMTEEPVMFPILKTADPAVEVRSFIEKTINYDRDLPGKPNSWKAVWVNHG